MIGDNNNSSYYQQSINNVQLSQKQIDQELHDLELFRISQDEFSNAGKLLGSQENMPFWYTTNKVNLILRERKISHDIKFDTKGAGFLSQRTFGTSRDFFNPSPTKNQENEENEKKLYITSEEEEDLKTKMTTLKDRNGNNEVDNIDSKQGVLPNTFEIQINPENEIQEEKMSAKEAHLFFYKRFLIKSDSGDLKNGIYIINPLTSQCLKR